MKPAKPLNARQREAMDREGEHLGNFYNPNSGNDPFKERKSMSADNPNHELSQVGEKFCVASDADDAQKSIRFSWYSTNPPCHASVSMTPDEATDIAAALLAHAARFMPVEEVSR